MEGAGHDCASARQDCPRRMMLGEAGKFNRGNIKDWAVGEDGRRLERMCTGPQLERRKFDAHRAHHTDRRTLPKVSRQVVIPVRVSRRPRSVDSSLFDRVTTLWHTEAEAATTSVSLVRVRAEPEPADSVAWQRRRLVESMTGQVLARRLAEIAEADPNGPLISGEASCN